MEFLAAPLLWGLAATGIPVLLHLMGRARPVAHRFPTLRFILKSQQASTRALRIKHLLVLLLRMLALALIALALARPLLGGTAGFRLWLAASIAIGTLAGMAFFHREFMAGALGLLALLALQQAYPRNSGGAERLSGDFVLVLDGSLSMSYAEPDGTRFELARRQALALLDRLSPESRVALVLAKEHPERLAGRLSWRQDTVRSQLSAAQPGAAGANLSSALNAAQEIARRSAEPAHPATIVLFTDLQHSSLNTLAAPENLSAALAPVAIVDVGSDGARNGAAAGLSLPSHVNSGTLLAITGKIRPVDPARRALVELYVDGRRIEQKYVEPHGQPLVETPFLLPTGAPGLHSGRMHLADNDRLPGDQDWYFTFLSGRSARALIVDSRQGEHRTSFFLKAALELPKASQSGGSGGNSESEEIGEGGALSISGLEVDTLALQQFTPERLRDYKVLILADCGDLNETGWQAIESWTDSGGGLFVWAGPNTAPATLARHGYQEMARNKGLLPAVIGELYRPERPLAIVANQPEHPLLQYFTPGVMAVLRETRVRELLKLDASARDDASTVVLGSGEGNPLLIEKSYGRGRVVLAAIDPGLAFSDLPRRAEAFVTLALNAVRMLAQQESELRARPGAALAVAISNPPLSHEIIWEMPSGRRSMLHLEKPENGGQSPPRRAPATAILPPLEEIGVHRLSWKPQGSDAVVARFFEVNVDAAESDLARAAPETVNKALQPWHAVLVKNVFDSPGAHGNSSYAGRSEYSALLLVLLICTLIAEVFLANRMYRPIGVQTGREAA